MALPCSCVLERANSDFIFLKFSNYQKDKPFSSNFGFGYFSVLQEYTRRQLKRMSLQPFGNGVRWPKRTLAAMARAIRGNHHPISRTRKEKAACSSLVSV